MRPSRLQHQRADPPRATLVGACHPISVFAVHVAQTSESAVSRTSSRQRVDHRVERGGLETRDTADSEVCATMLRH